MENTVRIKNKNNTLFIAHRGLSGIELENTNSSFIAAANRSYFGIETDVQITSDGEMILFHDDATGRVCEKNLEIKKTDYKTLKELNLVPQNNRKKGNDFKIPDLKDYLCICNQYEKTAVIELKGDMEPSQIKQVYEEVEKYHNIKDTIFISFWLENLKRLRDQSADAMIQYLTGAFDDNILENLKTFKMDLDIGHWICTKEVVDICHANNIKVNCWTVDDPLRAELLIGYGVDYITTDILE
ncbi:MAG: hypothetical protein IJ300_04740 [Clostridia bacterium]|nr:hypothetical protein [Clostridia bacterium]